MARLLSHKESVYSIDISRDGKYMLTTSSNNAQIWDIETGMLVYEGLVHSWNVDKAMFCRDQNYILTSGNGGFVTVWKYEPIESVISKLVRHLQTTDLSSDERTRFFY